MFTISMHLLREIYFLYTLGCSKLKYTSSVYKMYTSSIPNVYPVQYTSCTLGVYYKYVYVILLRGISFGSTSPYFFLDESLWYGFTWYLHWLVKVCQIFKAFTAKHVPGVKKVASLIVFLVFRCPGSRPPSRCTGCIASSLSDPYIFDLKV